MPRRPRAAPAPFPAPRLPPWAALCFLCSGAAGLVYEVVWSKELSHLLGNALHSTATVVAAFLTGLGLGALAVGPRLARRRQGARLYGALEIGIAVLGLASVPVLRALDPLLGALYGGLGGEGAAFLLARFLVLFLLMLPPALLMGATLPVLVAHFEYEAVGPALARLYALNTAGAVGGSLLAGFLLVPGIGLLAATWVAAALNLAAGLVAFAAARREAAPPAAAPPPPSATTALGGSWLRGRAAIGILFALSGFAALAFQIAWVRLFGLLLGSSVYSFAAVLAVYLSGLALGSAWVAPFTRRPGLLRSFALLQLAIALVTLAALRLFPWLPEGLLAVSRGAAGRWWLYYAGQVGLVAVVLALPCGLLGAVFPLAARLLQTRDGGHATGVAYAVNTAGTLVGSLAAGFVLIPTLGVQGTHAAAAAVSGAVGLTALGLGLSRREIAPRVAALGGAVAALAAMLGASAPAWDAALMSAGIYRPREAARLATLAARAGSALPGGPRVRLGTRAENTLFYREGVNGSVYVAGDTSGRHRWMRIGGKVEGSTADMKTQVLLGLLPMACVPSGAKAALVGLGTGITAAAALSAGPGTLEVVEIEPAVVEASRFFHAAGHDPLDDPRVRLVLNDARTRFTYSSATYDVIISEPSNPWIAGLNNLFTVEFYRLVRRRLNPGGVFCQWVQLYELAPETLGSLLASFLEVFPAGQAFKVHGSDDLLLLALPEPHALSLARLRAPDVGPMLDRAGLLGPEAVAAFYGAPFDSLRALARGARLNRDDLPVVEYRAPFDLYQVGQAALREGPGGRIVLPQADWAEARALFADWSVPEWYLGRVRQLARLGLHDEALASAREASRQGLAALGAELTAAVEADRRGHQVAQEHELARAAALSGRMAEAAEALWRAAALDPRDGRTWVLLAEATRSLGETDSARAAAGRAMAVGDSADRSDALVVLGLLEIAAARPHEAAERFREAQRWRPGAVQPCLFEARARRQAGDARGALEAARRGLHAAPGNAELTQLVVELSRPAQAP